MRAKTNVEKSEKVGLRLFLLFSNPIKILSNGRILSFFRRTQNGVDDNLSKIGYQVLTTFKQYLPPKIHGICIEKIKDFSIVAGPSGMGHGAHIISSYSFWGGPPLVFCYSSVLLSKKNKRLGGFQLF